MSKESQRQAIRHLLDEGQPADAMAAYFAFYYADEKVALRPYPAEGEQAQGYLCYARTGMDLFRPLVTMRLPKLIDMRGDPYERAEHEAAPYPMWRFDRAYLILPAVDYVAQHLATYKEFPPRQEAASFNLDKVLKALQKNPATN